MATAKPPSEDAPGAPNEGALDLSYSPVAAGLQRSAVAPARVTPAALGGLRASISQAIEAVIVAVIHVCGWSAILFVLAIFVFVFYEAAPLVFAGFDFVEFFTSAEWYPSSPHNPKFGILALIAGTVSVTVLAMGLAVPLGLGAAVFVSEFCEGRIKESLKIIIELLAAIPSVVWGFIGVMVLNPLIIETTGAAIGTNILNGGLILALMSVPVIVSVGEDSLKAVPDSFREAALALGASRWEIVYRVLFPAAKSGLLAAVLLGVGRAIGETMAVLMATGHAFQIPTSILDPVQTLTATIAAELGEAPSRGDHYRVLFLIGVVLFAIAMAVNLTADLVVKGIKGRQND